MSERKNTVIKPPALQAPLRSKDLSFLLHFSLEIHRKLNLAKVLQFFAEKAAHFLDADICLIHLLDDRGDSFSPGKSDNLRPGFTQRIHPKEGMGKILLGDKALIFPDLLKSPNLPWRDEALKEGLKAAICQPIRGNKKTIGILTAFLRKARRYSEQDLSLLATLTAYGASAIENARAYEKIKSQIKEVSISHITQTERSYQKLFDAVNDAIFSINQEGYFATFNRMFLRMTSYTENEIRSLHFSKILHPEDRPMMINDYQKVMRGEYAPERYTFRMINKEEKVIYVEGNFRRLKEKNEVVGVLGVLRDVTEKIKLERELLELSITDGLTGLHNQRHFYIELDREMERAKRQETPLCLLLFDLDGFKAYNDLNGHLEGDKVLKSVAEAVMKSIRKMDSAFRYGGDEFTVILPGARQKEGTLVAERIRKSFEKVPYLEQISLSIGLVEFDTQYDLTTFANHADVAMYAAKKRGGNQIAVFSPEMA